MPAPTKNTPKPTSKDTDSTEPIITFWNKNSRLILKSAVAIFLAFAAMETWGWFKIKQVENLQANYQQAATIEQRVAFAEANKKQPLAGLAFLSAADDSYENRIFEKSAEYYQKSMPSLKGTPLASRAILGLALSKIQLGQDEAGHTLLEGMLKDADTLDVFKAEASYQLATIALEEGNYILAKTYIDNINSFPFSGMWSQKAEILIEGNPHLKQDS